MIRSVYAPRERQPIMEFDKSAAKQAFKDECDINNIMSKYYKTGLISHVAQYPGGYDELPESIEYQEALNMIIAAEDAFASLPSSIRTQFENDPAEFLAFVDDPNNQDELVKMGLASAPLGEQPGAVLGPSEGAQDGDAGTPEGGGGDAGSTPA